MDLVNFGELEQYIEKEMILFNQNRIRILQEITFDALLEFNPYHLYLWREGNASIIIMRLLNLYWLPYENTLIADLLKKLALFISNRTFNGYKSKYPGIDLEFNKHNTLYLIKIDSGKNLPDEAEEERLAENFANAISKIKRSANLANVQPVHGFCFGNFETSYRRVYIEVAGQNFWYLISGNKDLYTDIIEPIGHKAREHDDSFQKQKAGLTNTYTKSFIERFCDTKGIIDWVRLVEFNCGNFDLEKFLPEAQEQP